jgi:hypothetical protein
VNECLKRKQQTYLAPNNRDIKKNSSCKHSADRVSGLARHVEFPLKNDVMVLYHIEL